MDDLQNKISYHFDKLSILKTALTHASHNTKDGDTNYERLEFLGDRVLGLVIAELIYSRYPEEAEGDLAKRHAALVQGTTLAIVAKKIDLGRAMIFSDNERDAGGAENDNILADGMEALLGALYIDGGIEECKRLIAKLWDDLLDIMVEPPQDPKTALQEWAQARGFDLPYYDQVKREGPDHAPIFTIKVSVGNYEAAQAEGPSRRLAEKSAAEKLLKYLVNIG